MVSKFSIDPASLLYASGLVASVKVITGNAIVVAFWATYPGKPKLVGLMPPLETPFVLS